jgi:ABC-type transporter Mla MlaB component
MSKDEPTGLFSRMAKFVRGPASNWGDVETPETRVDSQYSKQVLKEMLERRRSNDFVRKREFDLLRKIRQKNAAAGSQPGGLRPSIFEVSQASRPMERANTLRKIDEIEAQMSQQWWRTKHGSVEMSMPPESGLPASDFGGVETQPGGLDEAYLDTKRESRRRVEASRSSQNTVVQRPESGRGGVSSTRDFPPTGFGASSFAAVDVAEYAHDPELEEAAIRFANGDTAGAEGCLLDAVGPTGNREGQVEVWFALFDLYRATGQLDRFESVGLDYANRFNQSAPMWFSMPDQVGKMETTTAFSKSALTWDSPAALRPAVVAMLNAAMSKNAPPWSIGWSKLTSIDEAALVPLSQIMSAWVRQPVQLQFSGAVALERLLAQHTPSGDRSVNEAWWKLRLEFLRVIHRPDEFETVALDYCVTYEVSPPSWEKAVCACKLMDGLDTDGVGKSIVGESSMDSIPSTPDGSFGDTQLNVTLGSVELAGVVVDDAADALAKLDARLKGAEIMVISCARLIRVDFSAAGAILNWITTQQAAGRQVQFTELHRLIAAFFNVIGINEYAKLRTRRD